MNRKPASSSSGLARRIERTGDKGGQRKMETERKSQAAKEKAEYLPVYSREIEIGSLTRETERIYWRLEVPETREETLYEWPGTCRIEIRKGQTILDRSRDRTGWLSIFFPEVHRYLWSLSFRVRSRN